ncbi:hypothetical protein AAFF_G00210440 [Aldrovandia affinis]|uniref:DUF4592 domain-containing protein n=1 Tax=Aldrovandia affinis TaxID=143900 RepID=A0AAD7SWL0_9TELE|nr:hypothetical protein AAFF_G00210440 [Aldrovandia affinis]
METNTGEAEGSTEDITGKKKSKLKVLRTRLFGRMRKERRETEGLMKQSQSTCDVTTKGAMQGGDDSGDEFVYSHGRLGSRAMSHDSIFFADQSQDPVEPARVLSQENVHGKIKALQMKLQQQNIHLGPPPLLIPGKRTEDTGASSEDDGLPHSPPETLLSLHEGLERDAEQKFPDTHRHHSSLSLAGTGSEEEEQGSSEPPSHPLSPGTKPMPPTAPATLPGVDFNTPAQFTVCLDNSAARHRMSIKPRNQRASTKGRRLPSNISRPRSESFNALGKEEEEDSDISTDIGRFRSYSTQVIRSEEALRDPVIGKLSLIPAPRPSEEYIKGGQTETPRWDSNSSQRLSNEPNELEGRVTSNPLFLRPMPQGLDASWMLDSDQGTETAPPQLAQLQKPLETMPEPLLSKRPGICQPLVGKDPVKEVLSNPRQRDPPNNTPATTSALDLVTAPASFSAASENTPAKAPSSNMRQAEFAAQTSLSNRDSLKNSVQVVTHEPLAEAQFTPQSLTTPRAASILLSAAHMTSSLKRNIAPKVEGAGKTGSCPEPAQWITLPPAGLDDQPPTEGVNPGKQRPSSGSCHFSMASAWDRPRGGSLKGAKNTLDHQESPAKMDESLGPKTSSTLMQQKQPVVMSEEAKHKEQSRNPPLFQERANTQGKEDTPLRGMIRFGGGGDSRQKWVTAETVGGAEEGKESREIQSRQAEKESGGDNDDKTAFGVKLRSTSLSVKSRQDAAKPELKSKSLSAEVCPLGQPQNTQAFPQPLPHTKGPAPQLQQDTTTRSSHPLRKENEDRANITENPCLKPILQRKLVSPNSGDAMTPADPLLPSSVAQCENRDKERPGDLKRGGPAPKPASAVPKEVGPVVSEPTWMTMAREKTRSFQQLFTSRLPREFTAAAPTPKPTPQPAPVQIPRPVAQPVPHPAPQSASQHPPLATPHGRGDRVPQVGTEKTPVPQGRADRAAKMEQKERTLPAESTAPPADKREERTDRSFPMGSKTEPRKASTETHVTVSTAPHRAMADGSSEAKMEGRLACKIQTSEPVSNTTPVQRRDREDRQPMKTEASSLPSALSSGGQPSWMELAKRKSLAWSDKTMD